MYVTDEHMCVMNNIFIEKVFISNNSFL